MKILIVEDDNEIINVLKPSLKSDGTCIDIADDGEKGLSMAGTNNYDLIILDYILPKVDGKQICQALRKEGKDVPIIMLTVKTEISDKIELLNIGADDYVTKPFSLEELKARINSVMRRPKKMENAIIKLGDLAVDIAGHKAIRANEDIYLTRKEFALLEFLLKNQGKVMSRAMIIEHVWDMNADPFSNTIEAHILNLRKKIDKGFSIKLIHTIPGRGYKLSI